jgi:hypothetical protein
MASKSHAAHGAPRKCGLCRRTHGKTVTGFEKWTIDEWGFNCSILETTVDRINHIDCTKPHCARENVDRDADISII